ncbi:PhoH family protein [bacterium]|nr:PhoH family protein [bacterium]
METINISLSGVDQLSLLGTHDAHMRMIEEAVGVKAIIRDDMLILKGEPEHVALAERLFKELMFLLNRNGRLDRSEIDIAIDMIKAGEGRSSAADEEDSSVILTAKKSVIRAKTAGQERYRQAVIKNDIVFVIGPAGTGKTFLAVAMALAAFQKRQISRIVLARPAIEAGESLGYLPGDLMDKVDPYLKPLTDAIFSMLPADQLQRYVEKKTIEIIPLAYMRGRTLNNAFVILDEAQNTTTMQMKMFLTRLGVNSKAIITGDVTQIDLARDVTSGLVQIQDILVNIEGVAFIRLDRKDVVRHRLVKEIIQAYETYQAAQNGGGESS